MSVSKMEQTHYKIPGREKSPIELMRLGMTDAEFEGYCIGNVMKYVLRYKYIDFLIRSYRLKPILDDEE